MKTAECTLCEKCVYNNPKYRGGAPEGFTYCQIEPVAELVEKRVECPSAAVYQDCVLKEGSGIFKLKRVNGSDDRIRVYESEDGRLSVELSTCYSGKRKDRQTIMNRWARLGYVPKWMPAYLSVHTYYKLDDGGCVEWYNPQRAIKIYDPRTPEQLQHPNGKITTNFEWVFEATLENEKRLLAECERRYLNDERI